MDNGKPNRLEITTEALVGGALVICGLALAAFIGFRIASEETRTEPAATPPPAISQQEAEAAVREELLKAGAAQQAFRLAEGYFAIDTDSLTDAGWTPDNRMHVVIVSADSASYCMVGNHIQGGDTWTLSSDDGLTRGSNC